MITLLIPTTLAQDHLEDLQALPETHTRALVRDMLRAALVLEALPMKAYSARDVEEAQRLCGIHGPLAPLDGEGL